MKISIKTAICSVALTAAAIILCCTLMLITAAQSQIDNAANSGVTELRMLDKAFNAEMDAVGDDTLSETGQRSLILYVFREYTDASVSGSHYILTDTQHTMFNDSTVDPSGLFPGLKETSENAMKNGGYDDDSPACWPYMTVRLGGRSYLITGHWSDSLGERTSFEHEIFLARDITDVYGGITALGVRFAIIAFTTIILSAVIMALLIRRVMRPLKDLQKNAAALANGQYGERIMVRGKDEISELGESFNKMSDAVACHVKALEDTAEQRKLLLSALTHELKTPMTAIIGYSEALMRVSLKKTQKEESIAYINSECKRIERLSQKMIQLITLDGGEPAELKAQPVSVLFEAVEMTLQGIAKKENIDLAFMNKGTPVFDMDTDMMAGVLINLFDNARKAGARHITITADDNAISVNDDGSGIPADEIEKITQPFYMVDKSHSRSAGGSGLGLALCEAVVKAHGAKLVIESEISKGTVVTVYFEKITNR